MKNMDIEKPPINNYEEYKEEEEELLITLSTNATFADLFKAINELGDKEDFEEFHFDEELWDNFDEGIAEEILSFRDSQKEKAATTKVTDFFKKRGYSIEDVSVYLPIKFQDKT